jgi:hypothetical protein
MKYTPTTVNQAELAVLDTPYLGGEFALYVSHKSAIHIASIAMSAAAVGALTDNAATALPAGGTDLQIVTNRPLRSAVNTVVTLAVAYDDDVVGTAVGTFAPPAWATNQSKNFQPGYGVDLVPGTADKTFKTITGLTSIVGGEKNCGFDIWQLPAAADYTLIGCVKDVEWNDRVGKSVGIDCGLKSDAFVKSGKTLPGDLKLGQKIKGWADGLARIGGFLSTVMLVGIKDGQVTSDRVVFLNFRAAPKFMLPEGEGEATAEADGKFTDVLYFVAGYAP